MAVVNRCPSGTLHLLVRNSISELARTHRAFVGSPGSLPANDESYEPFEPFAESCRIVRYGSVLLLQYLILNLARDSNPNAPIGLLFRE